MYGDDDDHQRGVQTNKAKAQYDSEAMRRDPGLSVADREVLVEITARQQSPYYADHGAALTSNGDRFAKVLNVSFGMR